jgi:hypothetical protein
VCRGYRGLKIVLDFFLNVRYNIFINNGERSTKMRAQDEMVIEIGVFEVDAEDGSFSVIMKEVEVVIDGTQNEEDRDALGGGFIDIWDIKCSDIIVNYTQISDDEEVEYKYYSYDGCPVNIQEFIFDEIENFLSGYDESIEIKSDRRVRIEH